jgi:O-antigen/teichoic acid export membrane protein
MMSVRRSLGIVAVTRALVFIASFATVVVVSRLLTPKEIGVFSVSAALLGIAYIFRDFGVAQYLIQVDEVTPLRRRAAFTVTLAISWLLALLLAAVHPFASHFYGDPGVGTVVLLLAVNFLLLPFAAPLRTLLRREMAFGTLARVDLTSQLVASGATVLAALLGASYLSMALGSIAGNVVNVVMLRWLSHLPALHRPTRQGLREVLSFGWRASAASLATAAGSGAPDLIFGRTLGLADVALFSRANGLVTMALEQMMQVVMSVYGPAFAKGKRDGQRSDELYASTNSLLLGIMAPLIALLAVLAPALIVGLFGPQWQRAAPLGQWLCLFTLVTAPFMLAPTAMAATGHVSAVMRARLLCEAVRISLLFTSLWLPLEQVVVFLGLAYLAEAAAMGSSLRASLGLTTSRLLGATWRSYALIPFVVAGPLAMQSYAIGFDGTVTGMVDLVISAALGAVGWMAGLVILRHPLRGELRSLAAGLRPRTRGT